MGCKATRKFQKSLFFFFTFSLAPIAPLISTVFLLSHSSSISAAPQNLREVALENYQTASRLRTILEAKPQRSRTAAEYLKVINAYRAVYRTTPASSKADDSMMAIAELYQRMARDLKDAIYYSSAIKTYSMLQREYPGSPFRQKAAFTSAEILYDWLHDLEGAQEAFSDFLKKYPKSRLARNAKARLVELRAELKQKNKPTSLAAKSSKGQKASPEPGESATSVPLAKSTLEEKAPKGKAAKVPESKTEVVSETKVIASAAEKSRILKQETRESLPDSSAAIHVANPKSDGTRTLIRTLGLKIGKIFLDPGHGGHDTGTIGPSGLLEKDLVLDVALKLKTLIEEKLGGEVVLTRNDDTFIPLEARTEMANLHQADLFISIHANSSRNKRIRGIETFFLNFATSPDVEELAARENATSQKTIFELQDLIQKIALKEKIDESKEFARAVQKSMSDSLLSSKTTGRNRGVKQAPFIVLIGAQMPSILTEISFLSNPSDEKMLQTGTYRLKVAEALLSGIDKYSRTLSGIKTARNIPH